MRVRSGDTSRAIYFVAVDATDFTTRETGLDTFTVVRSRDGGADATMTDTVTEIDGTTMPGVYALDLDEDMTIGAGNDTEEMCFHITHAGMAPVTRTIELYRAKITAGRTLGIETDGDLSGLKGDIIGAANIADNAIAAEHIAAGAIGSSELATTAVDKIVDEIKVTLGALTTSAAAGDPTSTDTIMGYIKQLVNVLVGTAGVGTFPAAADPANAVSLAEVLRRIFDDTDVLGAMRGTDDAATVAAQTSMQSDVTAIKAETDKISAADAGVGTTGSVIEEIENNAAAIAALGTRPDLPTGTVAAGSHSATVFDTSLTIGTAGKYVDCWLQFTSATASILVGQAHKITAHATDGTITVEGGFTEAPVEDDAFVIINS